MDVTDSGLTAPIERVASILAHYDISDVDWEELRPLIRGEGDRHGGTIRVPVEVEWRNDAAYQRGYDDGVNHREARPTPVEPEALLRAVIEEVEAEEKRWLEWWVRGGKGSFVWKRDAVRAAKEALNGN